MNIVKLIPSVADLVFKARCVALVFAVNIELQSGNDASFVWFLKVAAASTPTSVLEPSVYM